MLTKEQRTSITADLDELIAKLQALKRRYGLGAADAFAERARRDGAPGRTSEASRVFTDRYQRRD